jgi:hypothetical protein
MPFDNNTRSCWTFFYDLHHGHVPEDLIPTLLETHMLECNCVCRPCRRLKEIWVEAGREETNDTPSRREN